MGYLEIYKESHSNFSNKKTDEREDEGDEDDVDAFDVGEGDGDDEF